MSTTTILILGGVLVVGGVVFFVASQGGGSGADDPRVGLPADTSSQERQAWLGLASAVTGAFRDVYAGTRTASGTGSDPKNGAHVGPAYDDGGSAYDWVADKFGGATGTASGTK